MRFSFAKMLRPMENRAANRSQLAITLPSLLLLSRPPGCEALSLTRALRPNSYAFAGFVLLRASCHDHGEACKSHKRAPARSRESNHNSWEHCQ